MAPASPKLQGSEALHAELTRVLGAIVEVRWSRVPIPVLGFLALGASDPTPIRLGVAAAAVAMVVTVAWVEHRRFQRGGIDPTFMARNLSGMALWHLAVFLLTGCLTSPVLPVFVVFTLGAHVLLGDDPAGRLFRVIQAGVLLLLVSMHLAGGDLPLTPWWLRAEVALPQVLIRAAFLFGLLRAAGKLGQAIRRLFDAALTRTADARDDLLDAHRDQAEALTALSGAIAHELKNPLASVKGLGGLLARDVPEGKPAERMAVLRAEVDRMQTILDGFLNFSRPAVPVVAVVADVRALCDDVVALHEGLARGRGVRLVVRGAGSARVDVRKTREILLNLVQNALDASPAAGGVQLEVAITGGTLTVTVEDEGPGLDATLGARVFEAGVTTKAAGSGLGLTVARALARQQGGDLTLGPRSPCGCRATLTLPIGGVE